MLPSTLDMEPSTLDPRQKDRLVRKRSHFLTGESAGVGDFDQFARVPRSAEEWTGVFSTEREVDWVQP